MVSKLLVSTVGEDQPQTARLLALAWAERLIMQIAYAEKADRNYHNVLSALERNDYDFPPDGNAAFRSAWVERHTVVWMTMQLTDWLQLVVDEAEGLASWKIWRNALEHLNEAIIQDGIATADEKGRPRQSIRLIPGGIHIGSVGGQVLPEVDLGAIRKYVEGLL